jgi:serine/threonine-protein kinase
VHTLGGRYQLEQRIGMGGMSEVWCGHDQVLDRPVAIKVMTPEQATDRASDDRVRAEARSAARLVHPNVAGVYDFGTAVLPPGREAPFIVMELVEGATLADHLAAGSMDWRIAVRICAEVSAALAAAHAHDIIHRDVKPANVMLTPSGAKVLDFGIATATGQADPRTDGTVLGTPAYLAPERLAGQTTTPATDMYALGVLLYQCLTGRLPWSVETGPQLLYAHRYRQPDPLPAIDGLADEVADLCARCLSKDPVQRPTSLVAALVLAEAVDARVYVPSVGLPAPRSRPAADTAYGERAAAAVKDLDMPTEQAPASEASRHTGHHVGRHRAVVTPDGAAVMPDAAAVTPDGFVSHH